MTSKRSRTNNFTQNEKELLVDIICSKINIIENKKCDANTSKEKEKAWANVALKFNSQNDITRSVSSLRTCWDNMKRRTRKSYKLGLFRTGEKQLEQKSDDIEQKVKDILIVSTVGVDNPFENDAEYNEEVFPDDTSTSIETSTIPSTETKTTALESDWNEWLEIKPANAPEEMKQPLKDAPKDTPRVNAKRKQCDTARSPDLLGIQEEFWEEKRKLVKLTIEHSIEDQKRKKEIHSLEIAERKCRIQLLELELKERII